MDGDSITIPKFTPVVLIRGAVNSPVGVAYAEGAKLGYYVRSGGGPTAQGERNRAYVMQPNGKVETSRRRMIFWTTGTEATAGKHGVRPDSRIPAISGIGRRSRRRRRRFSVRSSR